MRAKIVAIPSQGSYEQQRATELAAMVAAAEPNCGLRAAAPTTCLLADDAPPARGVPVHAAAELRPVRLAYATTSAIHATPYAEERRKQSMDCARRSRRLGTVDRHWNRGNSQLLVEQITQRRGQFQGEFISGHNYRYVHDNGECDDHG